MPDDGTLTLFMSSGEKIGKKESQGIKDQLGALSRLSVMVMAISER